MPESRPRYFTHYWTNDNWSETSGSDLHPTLDHAGSSQFRKRGVKRGDYIYVVTNRKGHMYLGGRMRVKEVCGKKQARRILSYEPWDAPDHVIGEDGTPLKYDRVVPMKVARALHFGPEQRPLRFRGKQIDGQTLRGVREMPAESAHLLDQVLDQVNPDTLKFVENRIEVAESLESFRRGIASHGEIARSLIRSTTYWVHDALTECFGPGKFVGYRRMTFARYSEARQGNLDGSRFDGHASRTAIEQALDGSFGKSTESEKCLRDWLRRAFGSDFAEVDASKWRFLKLSGVSFVSLPDEVAPPPLGTEGRAYSVTVNAYERDPVARRRCIDLYGTICSVCSVNLVEVYGEIAQGFIHIHHLNPIAKAGGARNVDPANDLRPVCPNCHAILHREDPPLRIEDLRSRMKRAPG